MECSRSVRIKMQKIIPSEKYYNCQQMFFFCDLCFIKAFPDTLSFFFSKLFYNFSFTISLLFLIAWTCSCFSLDVQFASTSCSIHKVHQLLVYLFSAFILFSTLFAFMVPRYTTQKSLPIYLKKGKYYYMEAIFKDDHQNDHLEAAVQTPDGTFYKVIPSQFLWTTLPTPPGRYTLILLYFYWLKVKMKRLCQLGTVQ